MLAFVCHTVIYQTLYKQSRAGRAVFGYTAVIWEGFKRSKASEFSLKTSGVHECVRQHAAV